MTGMLGTVCETTLIKFSKWIRGHRNRRIDAEAKAEGTVTDILVIDDNQEITDMLNRGKDFVKI